MEPPGVLKEESQSVPASHEASILLPHARIPDADSNALQRKLKNVVQRAEGGWQWEAGLPSTLWRKERQRRRLVVRGHRSATIVFPVHPEPRAVRGPLPGHVVIKVK